jgi:hypothetical protein
MVPQSEAASVEGYRHMDGQHFPAGEEAAALFLRGTRALFMSCHDSNWRRQNFGVHLFHHHILLMHGQTVGSVPSIWRYLWLS